MNCFKAIDDPSDQVATVAALRSPAFGCSDVDLFLHHENGGSFNYRAKRTAHGELVEPQGRWPRRWTCWKPTTEGALKIPPAPS